MGGAGVGRSSRRHPRASLQYDGDLMCSLTGTVMVNLFVLTLLGHKMPRYLNLIFESVCEGVSEEISI